MTRRIEQFRSLSPKTRAFVILSWSQWLGAALLLVLSISAAHLGSDPGMSWNGESGVIWHVFPGGPAERAGIREGDRLAAVEGIPITSGLPPFYSASRWAGARLLIEREGRLVQLDLQSVSRWEMRQVGFALGGTLLLHSANEYFRIGVNLWVLFLSGTILLLRPGLAQARVAAVALAYWVGGNSLLDVPGIGALTATWPMTFRFTIHFADGLFQIGFVALLVHFALLFPKPLPLVRRHRPIQSLPYLVGVPVLILATLRLSRVLVPELREGIPAIQISGLMRLYSPGMMMLALAILAGHLRQEPMEHDRRRLRWILFSLLPPFLTWMNVLALEVMQAPVHVIAISRTVMWGGIAAGTLLFAWAIVRHRLFETRVLLRKSIQYALARGTLLTLIAVPTTILIAFGWANRHRSIADLLSSDFVVLLSILVPLVLLLQYRHSILGWIDRRYFRDDFDAQQTLVRLISMIQKGSDLSVLTRMTIGEIDKALRPVHISFWKLDPAGDAYRSIISAGDGVATPPLSRRNSVVSMLSRQSEPVLIDLLYPGQSLKRHSSSGEFWIWLSVTRAALLVPVIVDHELSGFLLLGERRSEEPYSGRDQELLMTITRQLALTEAYSRLEQLSRQDPLTAALNRHAYYSLVEKRGDRGDLEAGCVAIVDLDELKKINDTLGHAAGDLAIRQVASAVRTVVRADDLVFRWGGDEFLIILFGITETLGRERLSTVNQHLARGTLSSAMPITVSVGLAPFANAGELATAIEKADAEMYASKHARRTDDVPET